MKKKLLALVVVVTTAAGLSTVSSGTAGATSCGIRWGSLAKTRVGAPSSLTNVRSGRHACFDRLVLSFAGRTPASRVGYVRAVLSQGEGSVVTLRGGAFLDILVEGPAYDVHTGLATYRPANRRELVD